MPSSGDVLLPVTRQVIFILGDWLTRALVPAVSVCGPITRLNSAATERVDRLGIHRFHERRKCMAKRHARRSPGRWSGRLEFVRTTFQVAQTIIFMIRLWMD